MLNYTLTSTKNDNFAKENGNWHHNHIKMMNWSVFANVFNHLYSQFFLPM